MTGAIAMSGAMQQWLGIAKELAIFITNHPETSGNERKAAEKYCTLLEERGYEVIRDYKGVPNAFLAKGKKKRQKKGVFLAEYDALPEIGHACGHSLSGAASLLAFLTVDSLQNEQGFAMDLMGTPGEEECGGKIDLLNNGGFEDYQFAAMVHMDNKNSAGFRTLASKDLYVTFLGKSAHASSEPEKGLNALNAARLFMDALDMWRQHIPPQSQIHGIIVHGGEKPNIVPDKTEVEYYLRAKTVHVLNELQSIVVQCAKAAAIATGTKEDVKQRYPTYADLFIPDKTRELLQSIYQELEIDSIASEGSQGSTDAGNVDQVMPVFHPTLAIEAKEPIILHHQSFADHVKQPEGLAAMEKAAKVLVTLVNRLSESDSLWKGILQEHREYRSI